MSTQVQNFKQLGYTSDHVWRSLDFKLGQQTHRVITWNLLYRCYSKAESRWGHANNPLNCSETMEEYDERKKQQIGEIVQLCYGTAATPGADFLLFQEADFFFPELYEKLAAEEQSRTPKDLPRSMALLGIYFKAVFDGYRMAIKDCDTYTLIKYEERELVLLYNSSKFEMIADSQATHLTYQRSHGSRDAVLSACFRNKASGEVIRVGTMHGEYSVDYTESVPRLLKSFQEVHVVIGGDMNHPPNYEISNLQVRDETETTNFMTNYDAANDGYTKVELDDPRSGTSKAYDGFITNMKEIKISGTHTWSKSVDETGLETPCLVSI